MARAIRSSESGKSSHGEPVKLLDSIDCRSSPAKEVDGCS